MTRPHKCRKVSFSTDYKVFKPTGASARNLEIVNIALDEIEAIRLTDLEGLYQEDAAKKMDVSRQTLGNILTSARKKLADAVVNGKLLKIEGGNVAMDEMRKFVCEDCAHSWELPHGTGRPNECPECKSENIHRDHAETERRHRSGKRGSCEHND